MMTGACAVPKARVMVWEMIAERTWHEHFPHWPEGPVLHPALEPVLGPGPRDTAELRFAQHVDAAPKAEDLDVAYAALSSLCRSADNRGARGEPIVVGVGLGGPERPDRAAFFAAALQRFRALGLKLDLHSGEQAHVTAAEHRAALATLR